MRFAFYQDDKEYSENLLLFNGMVTNKPEVIFVCKEKDEVRMALDYARTNLKTVSILGCGHNVSGRATSGQVVISTRNMRQITILQTEQLAICEPGITMSAFDYATNDVGLVCTGGTVSSTGIAGLTLGGGIGWLHGNLGSTSDNVTEFEILDYNGNEIICNENQNQKLFWVLRGAGFGFGVITKITYRLHKMRKFVGYNCILPFSEFSKVTEIYAKVTMSCSDKTTFFLSFLTASNNEKIISIEIAFSNFENTDSTEFDKILYLLRSKFSSTLIKEDTIYDYVKFQSFFDNDRKYGMRSYWKSIIKDKIESPDLSQIKTFFEKSPSNFTSIFIERYHGKMSSMPNDFSAFDTREKGYGILITSTWNDRLDDEKNIEWTKLLHSKLVTEKDVNYINYLSEPVLNKSEEKKAFANGKLTKIKEALQLYNPDGLFTTPFG